MDVNDFIRKLQAIEPEKRKLPIKTIAPNGLRLDPKIKMEFDGSGSPLNGDKLISMVITY